LQDDQIGPKIIGLAQAEMARLPPSIITKNYIISSEQPSLSPTLNLPCFTREIVRFYEYTFLLVLRFLWFHLFSSHNSLNKLIDRKIEWLLTIGVQACQMVCFQTKNTNLGNSLKALEWKM
jgi:hypothetical protein